MTALIRRGLTDISVSRSPERARGWGVPVPESDEVVYVWFDALANYLTGLGYGSNDALYKTYWEGDGERIHVVGKGISKFHAVYWPAILISAGQPLPSSILVHGYLTVDGRKIGKSAGNGIAPERLIEAYGCPDALRYYLLRHIRSADDGDFSEEKLDAAWSGELAGQLGNLANRVLALVSTVFGGVTPTVPESPLVGQAEGLYDKVKQAFDRYELHVALSDIFSYLGEANKVFTRNAPWTDAKALLGGIEGDEREEVLRRLEATLAEQIHGLAVVARCLLPFIPRAAVELHARLGISVPSTYQQPVIVNGIKTTPGSVLFPRKGAL